MFRVIRVWVSYNLITQFNNIFKDLEGELRRRMNQYLDILKYPTVEKHLVRDSSRDKLCSGSRSRLLLRLKLQHQLYLLDSDCTLYFYRHLRKLLFQCQ